MPGFVKLNNAWDADPNVPEPECSAAGQRLRLRFFLNRWPMELRHREQGTLTFSECSRWRLGATNDEGWYLGQCRYSRLAPSWGNYYEIVGVDEHRDEPSDWVMLPGAGRRHFLFYFRDETFECFASDWRYQWAGAEAGPVRPT